MDDIKFPNPGKLERTVTYNVTREHCDEYETYRKAENYYLSDGDCLSWANAYYSNALHIVQYLAFVKIREHEPKIFQNEDTVIEVTETMYQNISCDDNSIYCKLIIKVPGHSSLKLCLGFTEDKINKKVPEILAKIDEHNFPELFKLLTVSCKQDVPAELNSPPEKYKLVTSLNAVKALALFLKHILNYKSVFQVKV